MVSRSNKIVLIEGPNLNLIEKRKEIYQSKQSLNDILIKISEFTNIDYYQSNTEGEIINKLQKSIFDDSVIGIIINPAGYTHYSVAISDTLEIISNKLKVEVHLTNLYKRENFRKNSYTAQNVDLVISGAGNYGYYLAAKYIVNNINI